MLFTIGDAIAGLGIFLLIPQYLKPIYIFRLRVLGVGMKVLYALPGIGFFAIIVGSLTPYMPQSTPELLRGSLFWEITAAFLWALSYGVLGWVSIFPARPSPRSIGNYVRAGVNLLAGASEEDRVELASDILANVKRLIGIADGAITARNTGHDPAAFCQSFLRILADPVFCRTLVARLPWDAARILKAFSESQPKQQVGRAFVHQIARQTLIASESDDPKDSEWHGFTDAPPLLRAAFGDPFLNRNYLPWEGVAPSDFDTLDEELMERICAAAKLTIDEHVVSGFPAQSYNIARLQENFEVVSRRIAQMKKADADISRMSAALGHAVRHIVEATRKYCDAISSAEREALYADPELLHDSGSIDSVTELILSVLENTSQDFSGYDDKFWRMAREIWDAVLPRFGAQPAGMDPLQQRFALKLVEKTRESMEGWYSPLLRQTLALLGPYVTKGESKERTAFKICRDALYRELAAYPAFYERDAERAKSLLPNNVRYDAASGELVHRYSFGGEDRTKLTDLAIPEVSFAPDAIGLSPPAGTPVVASTRYE